VKRDEANNRAGYVEGSAKSFRTIPSQVLKMNARTGS